MKPGQLINLIDHLNLSHNDMSLHDIMSAINTAKSRYTHLEAGGYINIRYRKEFHQFTGKNNLSIPQLALLSLVQQGSIYPVCINDMLDASQSVC